MLEAIDLSCPRASHHEKWNEMKNLLAKCPIDIKDNSLQYHAAVNDVMTLAFAQGRKASCWILIFHGECSDSGV